MTLEELKAAERKLWAELSVLRQPYEAKQREWSEIAQRLQKLVERELLKRELVAELEKEKTNA